LQTGQTAACNRLHDIAERLARWLLMCHDRMESDNFYITHEFLSHMLELRDPRNAGGICIRPDWWTIRGEDERLRPQGWKGGVRMLRDDPKRV